MESVFFETFIWSVTGVTLFRLATTMDEKTLYFLGLCVLGQMAAIAGMRTKCALYIASAHIVFTSSLWIGSMITSDLELRLIAFLCVFTLATRHLLGHCMFAKARGATTTNDVKYDAFYIVPLVLSLYRLSQPADAKKILMS